MLARGSLAIAVALLLLAQPTLSRRRQRRRGAPDVSQDPSEQRPLTPQKGNAGRFAKRQQSWRQIALEHYKTTTNRKLQHSFSGESLAYVTPWNGHGYDVAKALAERFDYVSPVWFQVRSEQGLAQITGLHDIDRGWIKAVRAPCSSSARSKAADGSPPKKCPKIVPRFVWEAAALTEAEQTRVVSLIVDVIVGNQFDGLVFEAPVSSPMLYWLGSLRLALQAATQTTRTGSADRPLELVLVLPPTVVGENGQVVQGLDRASLRDAARIVDKFSLMTYDYSTGRGVVGPNAPLAWMEESVRALLGPARGRGAGEDDEAGEAAEAFADGSAAATDASAAAAQERALARKMLLGLNMYGTDNGQPITGGRYLELLRKHKPRISLDADAEEHYFEYLDTATRQRHQVWYPTLYSIRKRQQLAEELGVGVAMWEVGQGLDFFYDLF